MKQLTHYNIENKRQQFPITIVCDAIRTPENIGMCFRVAESFGVEKIYIHENSIGLENRKVKKAPYLPGDWIKESILYSTMIRTSAAWDHDRSGRLDQNNIYHMKETGSFIKMLALLPLLQKMGVDVENNFLPDYEISSDKKELSIHSIAFVLRFKFLRAPTADDDIASNSFSENF